jgi:hypothetical protein
MFNCLCLVPTLVCGRYKLNSTQAIVSCAGVSMYGIKYPLTSGLRQGNEMKHTTNPLNELGHTVSYGPTLSSSFILVLLKSR